MSMAVIIRKMPEIIPTKDAKSIKIPFSQNKIVLRFYETPQAHLRDLINEKFTRISHRPERFRNKAFQPEDVVFYFEG